ncbi:MAG: glycosyltransferase family 4 protein [Burkholderiales bacterium]
MNACDFRIALIGPLPPPYGGMANQTRQLAELLRGEGVAVEMIQVNAPYRPAWLGHLRGVRSLFRLLPYLAHLWVAAGRNNLFHVMANSGWSWHLYAAPAIWIARLRGTGVVVNYRGGEAEAFFARAFSWVKPSLMRTSAIVVPSGFLASIFAARGFATRIVPNIVSLECFTATSVAEKPAAPHLLVARNLEPLYDNATALRAFARIRQQYPSARLTIAGSGPERNLLEQLARSLGIADAVTFAGRVENTEMPAVYRTVRIALNPSLADNMPISILEALASGVPVVSTNVGGVPFLVENEKTALLVPPGDAEAMAAACMRILADTQLAQRLIDAGQALAREFAWSQVRGRLFDVYREALDGSTRLPARVVR